MGTLGLTQAKNRFFILIQIFCFSTGMPEVETFLFGIILTCNVLTRLQSEQFYSKRLND